MKRGLADLDVNGRRVFVRADLNVPLDGSAIRDDSRIKASLPTIRDLRDRGARVVLASHLGRPRGAVRPELSLAPVAERLGEFLGASVPVAPDSMGPEVERLTRELVDGDVLLLENVRFHPGEEANEPDHVRALAGLADCYVNDAFGTAHRAHASTTGLAHALPAAAGHLMLAELHALDPIVQGPPRPFAAIVGGAKISDKITLLERLAATADLLILGGAMANTFLAADGVGIGRSRAESAAEAVARIRSAADAVGCRLVLPVDAVVADAAADDAAPATVGLDAVPTDAMILDIGPASLAAYAEALARARTVLWNGPVGVYELAPFATGTLGLARLLAHLPAEVVVAGGDAVAAAQASGRAEDFAHLSTGGGATLELIEGRELPGVAALPEA
ncbi:MAG: phosphoglycerate kinase [Chloroflexi bacterium]|nr:phosphoglycerate kinase [Chloroflexota bacterium]